MIHLSQKKMYYVYFLLLIFILPSQITRSSQTVCCCYKNMNEHLSTDKTQLLHVKNVFFYLHSVINKAIQLDIQTWCIRESNFIQGKQIKNMAKYVYHKGECFEYRLPLNFISKLQLNAYVLKLYKHFWYLCSVLPSTNLQLSKRSYAILKKVIFYLIAKIRSRLSKYSFCVKTAEFSLSYTLKYFLSETQM